MTKKIFLSLFTLAAFMRAAFIWRAPLWYDENFTLILARLPFARMMQATAGDVHPPLWYVIEWVFYHAFPSLPAWAIRIPALVFSLLAFWMFAKLISLLQIPPRVQIASAALMAILPMQIWYGQEGRMYSLLEFLVLAALYTGLTRKWIAFTLACVAMCYTQNYGVIYCAVIGLILLVVMEWREVKYIYLAGFVTAGLYLPWAYVVRSQMDEIQGRYWIFNTDAGSVLNALYKLFWASSMMEPGIVVSYVLTFAALIIGLSALMREKVKAWWIVLTMAFAPVGIVWIVSVVWQPLLLFRPLIGISPFLYLIVALPVGRWWQGFDLFGSYRDRRLLFTACFSVPVFMFGILGYYINIPDMKGEGLNTPIHDTLTYVRNNWQEGDVIFYADDGPMVNLMPYAGDLPQIKMPACEERAGFGPVLGSLSDTTRQAIGIRIADLDDVPHVRAWVFAPRSPLHPQCYEDQIKDIAPLGEQVITVDDSKDITSGVWLVEK